MISPNTHAVIGWLSHRDVLLAYNAHLERSVQQATQGATKLPDVSTRDQPTAAPVGAAGGTRWDPLSTAAGCMGTA